jgi:hypothetical protein
MDTESLFALGKHLPDEVAEALIWLAEGEAPESVLAYLGRDNGAEGERSTKEQSRITIPVLSR